MKTLSRAEWADLIFILSLLLGAFVRVNPNLLASFPLNQGGMFAVMVQDLKANHYGLPAFILFRLSVWGTAFCQFPADSRSASYGMGQSEHT